MTTTITRLTELLCFDRAAPGGPARAGRCYVGIAFCTLALLAAAPANAPAQGSLVSWGYNIVGQVSGTPAGAYAAIAAGGYHSMAIAQPPAQQIAYLSESVLALVDGGVSLPGDGTSLQATLDAAAAALGRSDAQAAIGSQNGFISQVEAYVRKGKLTQAEGESLIDVAWLIITDLGG